MGKGAVNDCGTEPKNVKNNRDSAPLKSLLGSLSNYRGNANENVTQKANFTFL